MNFKCFIKGMILFIPLLLSSCNDEESTSLENKCKIICSVDEFESANPSRTNADPNDFSSITWASGDVIGIFPREGYQEPFEIPIDQIGKKSASFDGGYWDVKDGLQYNAYYPFDKRNFDSADMKTRIPITYIGQKQNGSSCDIGAFDYTYSDWNTATNGSIGFDFHHIGAIGVFSLKYPATTTYTKMTLSVDDALIPLEGCYDLTANDVSMIPDENSLSTSIDLKLTNCSGVAGETGVFYMMLPPMDLSTKEVTLSLTSAAGTTCTYSIEKAMNVKKGKLYRRTGIPVESKVEGTVDGWVEEESIPYVTFTADAVQSLYMTQYVATLEYSVNNGEWKVLGTNSIQFGSTKGNLRLRGKNSNGTAKGVYSYSTIKFTTNASVACSGDIRTLLDYENYLTVSTDNARFCGLFYKNSQLVSAPELPATTLAADYCYYIMFSGCTSLTSAPALPATTLASNCYCSMFSGCTSLTSAPALPATTLAAYCYWGMFEGCTSLTSVPALPATTLAWNCYWDMFSGCTSLTSAPALPATTLALDCYRGMFRGCTSLTPAPALPATALASNCYRDMFSGCTSLTSAPALPATTLAKDCYYGMFSGCTSLTSAPVLPATTLAEDCYYGMFSGCTSLTSAPVLPATTLASCCYESMFSGCTSLTSAPALPATTLAPSCYSCMFSGCIGLTSAPELPATTLAYSCYSGMFRGCTGLTSSPGLPATTLAYSCYSGMFQGCTGLTSAPELPVTTLAESCYKSMFSGCIGLTSAPELPATTLAESCYESMFSGCTSLTSAPHLPAPTLADYCYYGMFKGCIGLISAPELLATRLFYACYAEMFNGCDKLNNVTMLATDIGATWCLSDWLDGVSSTGTFTKAKSMTILPKGTSGIPNGWIVIDQQN